MVEGSVECEKEVQAFRLSRSRLAITEVTAERAEWATFSMIWWTEAGAQGVQVALEGGLVLSILRYPNELRNFTPYFEGVTADTSRLRNISKQPTLLAEGLKVADGIR